MQEGTYDWRNRDNYQAALDDVKDMYEHFKEICIKHPNDEIYYAKVEKRIIFY